MDSRPILMARGMQLVEGNGCHLNGGSKSDENVIGDDWLDNTEA